MKRVLSVLVVFAIILSTYGIINVDEVRASEINSVENTEEYISYNLEDSFSELTYNDENIVTTLKIDRDGSDGYELGLMVQYGVLFEDVAAWHPSNRGSSIENLTEHYNKHKKEVNAKNCKSYLVKSIEFRRTAKKGVKPRKVSGYVEGVKRYSKNGRYIDLAPDGRIISFGDTN